jgi:hypothetical protein
MKRRLLHSVLKEQKIIDTLRIRSQHFTFIDRTQEIEHSELRLLKVPLTALSSQITRIGAWYLTVLNYCITLLRIRIRDPVLFLPPRSWMEKIHSLELGSGIQNKYPGSYFQEIKNNFWVKITLILCC